MSEFEPYGPSTESLVAVPTQLGPPRPAVLVVPEKSIRKDLSGSWTTSGAHIAGLEVLTHDGRVPRASFLMTVHVVKSEEVASWIFTLPDVVANAYQVLSTLVIAGSGKFAVITGMLSFMWSEVTSIDGEKGHVSKDRSVVSIADVLGEGRENCASLE